MTKILFVVLLLAGFLYLVMFNKPRHHSVEDLQRWFDVRLSGIADGLHDDIELDRKGQYRHAGRQDFAPRGEITYRLLDKHYARFEISQKNALEPAHIKDTDGYRALEARARDLGLRLRLDEVQVEGDDVDDDYSLDEYIDDIPRYYTVTVSGWQ